MQAVAPSGLGSQLGLNPGDVINSLKVGSKDERPINSPADLSGGLIEIFNATMAKDNKEQAANIVLKILQRGEKEKTIEGAIIRTDLFDRADGATLYEFRPNKRDDAKKSR